LDSIAIINTGGNYCYALSGLLIPNTRSVLLVVQNIFEYFNVCISGSV